MKTKKIRIELAALVRIVCHKDVEVPEDFDDNDLSELADELYFNLDGGEFTDQDDFWERGTFDWYRFKPGKEPAVVDYVVTRDEDGDLEINEVDRGT